MKFNIGEVPTLESFNDDGLKLLREPDEKVFESIIGVLFVVFLLSMLSIWLIFIPVNWPESTLTILLQSLLIALILIPVHEGLHAIMYPHKSSGEVVLGYWPQKYYFYAAYTGQVSRNRLIVVYVTPFLFLSILPIVMAMSEDAVPAWLALASIINAGFSSADLYIVYLLVSQVPRNALVQNNGWQTYWH